MKTIVIDGILIAMSPIHHGGNEKTGSTVALRKIENITNDGIQEVPYLHGNSFRGRLRRILAKDFLDRVGYKPKSTRLKHFMWGGGTALEKTVSKDSGTINIDFKVLIEKYITPISLLGGSFLNQTFTSKMLVKHAFPICKELENLYFDYDESKHGKELYSFYELVTNSFQTRRDDLQGAKDTYTDEDGDEQVIERESQQMLIEYEVFIQGSRFKHSFILNDTTLVQEGCFNHMLDLWGKHATIGGKSSSGLGELRLMYDIPDVLGSSEEYFDFIENNKDKIIQILEALDNPRLKSFDFVKDL